MIFTMQQVVREVGITESDLLLWIEQRWVLPSRTDNEFLFDDVDLARARLIRELRTDMMVNEEAIPVILSLLDQIHSLRRALARVNEAIDKAPATAKAEITRLLEGTE